MKKPRRNVSWVSCQNAWVSLWNVRVSFSISPCRSSRLARRAVQFDQHGAGPGTLQDLNVSAGGRGYDRSI
jgi:hypothetical protein